VLQLMRQGKSDEQVKQFLVARYGEFVLYQPRVESKTWLLWFGPVLLLLAGGFVVARVVRRHAATASASGDGMPENNTPEDSQEW
jgi:cytochrome c-type biogenesis protein CcmH